MAPKSFRHNINSLWVLFFLVRQTAPGSSRTLVPALYSPCTPRRRACPVSAVWALAALFIRTRLVMVSRSPQIPVTGPSGCKAGRQGSI